MNQSTQDTSTLHLVVCGCEVCASFAHQANQNVYQQIKLILLDSCLNKMENDAAKAK